MTLFDMFPGNLEEAILEELSSYAGEPVESIDGGGTLAGGCINNAMSLQTRIGTFFLKYNSSPLPMMFAREMEGLKALHDVGAITVPRSIASRECDGNTPAFLITSYIESESKVTNFFSDFGRRFARLHKDSLHDRCGFEHDNYIGSTPQINTWTKDWVSFFGEHRIEYQLRLAHDKGHRGNLQTLGKKFLSKLDNLIGGTNEKPCLLHGDLWSGNYMVAEDGTAAIIDPAAYYGHREADLAMTRLFGGFSGEFYRSYNEEFPLPDETEMRQEIYELYHLLNHLNLFGSGYLGQCERILKRYAG